MTQLRPISRVFVFCVLAGIVATFARGYYYAAGNQLEHLPIVLRLLDPSYLTRDFFVNASMETVGPRTYYAQVLAALGRAAPLPVVVFTLTLFSKICLALITYWAAYRLFRGLHLAGMLACALVLSVDSITLGGSAQLIEPALSPSLLVRPMALLSLWLALNGRLYSSAAVTVIVLPIHPLLGFETAGIALAASGLAGVIAPCGADRRKWPQALFGLLRAATAGALVLAVAWLLFGGGLEKTLSTEQFIHILTQSRAPHHYLPSTFGVREYIVFIAFLVAMAMSWNSWRQREQPEPALAYGIVFVVAVVLASLVAGYLFVEVFPSRLWTMAQTFRMVYLIKWLGLVLFAGTAARWITRGETLDESIPGWLLLMGTGLFQPVVALFGHLLERVRIVCLRRATPTIYKVLTGMVLIATVSLSISAVSDPAEVQSVAIVAGLGFWMLLTPRRWPWRLAPVVIVLGFAAVLVWTSMHGFELSRFSRPIVTLEAGKHTAAGVATFARTNTAEDALFLTPPDLGIFRLLARRAMVADSYGFAFSDRAMAHWYERMADCFAEPEGGVISEPGQLDGNYRRITDDRVRRIARMYGADYAVLYPETPTELPILYRDAYYKLVDATGRTWGLAAAEAQSAVKQESRERPGR